MSFVRVPLVTPVLVVKSGKFEENNEKAGQTRHTHNDTHDGASVAYLFGCWPVIIVAVNNSMDVFNVSAPHHFEIFRRYCPRLL